MWPFLLFFDLHRPAMLCIESLPFCPSENTEQSQYQICIPFQGWRLPQQQMEVFPFWSEPRPKSHKRLAWRLCVVFALSLSPLLNLHRSVWLGFGILVQNSLPLFEHAKAKTSQNLSWTAGYIQHLSLPNSNYIYMYQTLIQLFVPDVKLQRQGTETKR